MEMEVDCQDSSPRVLVESAPGSPDKSSKERMLDILDKIELRVERLRQEACRLEEEKDKVLTTLVALRNSDMLQNLGAGEREDVLRYADRVTSRCLTVEVPMKIERDEAQEESLHVVNSMIDALVVQLRADPGGSRQQCLTYLNACSSSVEQDVTDKTFEATVLACSVDDQKHIQKRLQGLLNYIDKNT
ncbi:BAG family molecular chaperone regulator 2 [Frankliniella occidentalis]|uniref:BAG family molecular chaperone regulator 2 n=1 Tax=Frankliniella occidentalis TaxID=133901 RepID=A0A6J1T696_FRAOC|nr:BAG family molecular chaperone regulator 2 [Frankliniella occidentalis]